MTYVKLPLWQLDILIEGLESAIKVCYSTDNVNNLDNCENSYPYAVGFSKATMQRTIQTIQTLKEQI